MSQSIRFPYGYSVYRLVLGFGLCAQVSCNPDVSRLSGGSPTGESGVGSVGASGAPTTAGNTSSSESGANTGGTMTGGAGTGGTTTVTGDGGQIAAGGSEQMGGGGAAAGFGGGSGGAPARTDLLSFSDGRVVPNSNGYGIDGVWRSFGADPELITTDFTGDRICAKGKVLGVANGNYGRYWGGGVQLVLRQNGAPYNAAANGLAGISIVLDGNNVPSPLRLKFKESSNTDNYCKNIKPIAGSPFDLTTSTATRDCWIPGGNAVDPTALESFDLHVVPETPSDISFDFCITQATVIPL